MRNPIRQLSHRRQTQVICAVLGLPLLVVGGAAIFNTGTLLGFGIGFTLICVYLALVTG